MKISNILKKRADILWTKVYVARGLDYQNNLTSAFKNYYYKVDEIFNGLINWRNYNG